MASKKVNIDITTKADTSGAQKAATAMDNLAAAGSRAGTGAETAAKGTSRVGQVASAAGFQVQDFAVQVAGGTSALTAMAQQAPQFLGVFGPQGAIAGALISVGAVAFQVFRSMGENAEAATKEADALSEAFQDLADKASKKIATDNDFGLSQLNEAKTQATNLIGLYNDVIAAQNASATASITNAQKIREAEETFLKMQGQSVDAVESVTAKLNAQAQLRAEANRQELAAEQKKVEDAKARVAVDAENLAGKQQIKAKNEELLATEQAKLTALRAQTAELEKQAQQTQAVPLPGAGLGVIGTSQRATQAALQAKAQLADPGRANVEELIEKKIADLRQQLNEKTGALSVAVRDAAATFAESTQQMEAAKMALEEVKPRIEQTLQAEDVKASAQALVELSEVGVENIKEIIEQAKPVTESQKAAVETLKGVVIDNKLAADELMKTSSASQTLASVLPPAINGMNANIKAILSAVQQMERINQDTKRQIEGIYSRLKSGS